MRTERERVIDGYVKRSLPSSGGAMKAPKEIWEENEKKRAKEDVPVDKEVARERTHKTR